MFYHWKAELPLISNVMPEYPAHTLSFQFLLTSLDVQRPGMFIAL